MGFSTSSSAAQNNTNTDWKAQAFINLYLPDSETGKPRKLGAIALKVSNPAEKGLMEWLQADPTRVKNILAALTADFHAVDPAKPNGFKLG